MICSHVHVADSKSRRRATEERFGLDRKNDVERGADVEPEEARRRDADDRVGHSLDGQGPADRVRCAAEAPLPESMAYHGYWAVPPAATAVVAVVESPADRGRQAQHLEHFAGGPNRLGELELAGLRQAHAIRRPREGPVEETPLADPLPHGITEGKPFSLLDGAHDDELVRLADR